MKFGEKSAIAVIEQVGAILVFPVNNKKEPASLWYAFYPRSEMIWEWDENGDHRVGDLWHLRTALSTTRKAVYVKWYQGRATYLSRRLFTALLRSLNSDAQIERSLSPLARKILGILNGESPLSTKELKRLAELKGRDNEAVFQRAMKELWSRLLIVAFGEVDDGAFPSLAVGSTQVIFEDLWRKAFEMDSSHALCEVGEILSAKNPFAEFFAKLRGRILVSEKVSKPRSSKSKPMPSKDDRSVVSFHDLVRRSRL